MSAAGPHPRGLGLKAPLGRTAGFPRLRAEGSGRFLPAGLAPLAQAAGALFSSLLREKRKTRQAPARRKRDLPGSHSPLPSWETSKPYLTGRYSRTLITTRRFRARPSRESFSVTGCSSPKV